MRRERSLNPIPPIGERSDKKWSPLKEIMLNQRRSIKCIDQTMPKKYNLVK
jgi:hypothetical protein